MYMYFKLKYCRKFFFILSLLVLTISFEDIVYATRIPFIWHTGFKIGISKSDNNNNFSDAETDIHEEGSNSRVGGSAGTYLSFTHKDAEYVNLQLELNYYQKGFKKIIRQSVNDPYQNPNSGSPTFQGASREYKYVQKVYLEYIGLPLLLKLDFGTFFNWNDKMYVLLGTGTNILVTGVIKQSNDVLNVYKYYERVEFDYQLGIGYNFFKLGNFHLFSEIRYMKGISEINKVTNNFATQTTFTCFYVGIDYLLD